MWSVTERNLGVVPISSDLGPACFISGVVVVELGERVGLDLKIAPSELVPLADRNLPRQFHSEEGADRGPQDSFSRRVTSASDESLSRGTDGAPATLTGPREQRVVNLLLQ